MVDLVGVDEHTVRCSRENRTYKVLFSREPIALPIPPPPTVVLDVGAAAATTGGVPAAPPTLVGLFCAQHPTVPATQQCKSCGTFLCGTCDFAFSDGTHLCAACATKAPSPASISAPPRLALAGMRCSHHRNLPATQQCRSCGAYLCDTCDFAFPDGTHLCSACATKPSTDLTKKQKQSMIWSYVCAGGATLGFIGTMAIARTALHRSQNALQAVGLMFLFFVLLPSAAGTALGFSATRRGHPTGWSVRGAIIWNAFLLGVFLLLTVIGNLK